MRLLHAIYLVLMPTSLILLSACSDENPISQNPENRIEKSSNLMGDGWSKDDFEIIVDAKTSQLWILHENPFHHQTNMKKVIYDEVMSQLIFIAQDNKLQRLSVDFKKSTIAPIRKAKEITAIQTRKGEILDIFVVPFSVK